MSVLIGSYRICWGRSFPLYSASFPLAMSGITTKSIAVVERITLKATGHQILHCHFLFFLGTVHFADTVTLSQDYHCWVGLTALIASHENREN